MIIADPFKALSFLLHTGKKKYSWPKFGINHRDGVNRDKQDQGKSPDKALTLNNLLIIRIHASGIKDKVQGGIGIVKRKRACFQIAMIRLNVLSKLALSSLLQHRPEGVPKRNPRKFS